MLASWYIFDDKIRETSRLSTGKGEGKSEYLGSTEAGAAAKIGRKKPEGDPTIKLGVLDQVDLAHAAGADLLDDSVLRCHRAAGDGPVRPGRVVVRLAHALKCSHSSFTRSISFWNCSSRRTLSRNGFRSRDG